MKLTEEHWGKTLSEEQFRVCRKKGTERPFIGELFGVVSQGEYLCSCCGENLFSSEDKFDSGCGWPTFSVQSKDANVQSNPDNSHGMRRIEVVCKNWDAHLGHVFDDGPTPTGKRYCINSVAIKFAEK